MHNFKEQLSATYPDGRLFNGLQVDNCTLDNCRIDIIQAANQIAEDMGESSKDDLVVLDRFRVDQSRQHSRLLRYTHHCTGLIYLAMIKFEVSQLQMYVIQRNMINRECNNQCIAKLITQFYFCIEINFHIIRNNV